MHRFCGRPVTGCRRSPRRSSEEILEPTGFEDLANRFSLIPIERLDSIRLALAQEAPLLCDDAALCSVARSLGIQAFNTLAFLEAVTESEAVASVVDSAVEALFGLCAVDLPVPPAKLLELARQSNWKAGPTQVLLTRPAIWRDPAETLRTLDSIFQETSDRESSFAATLAYSACVGLARSLGAGNKRGILALVFVSALISRGFQREDVPELLAATRTAAEDRGLGDILVECGQALWHCFEGVVPYEIAGNLLLDLMEDIPPEDRQTLLTEVILGS